MVIKTVWLRGESEAVQLESGKTYRLYFTVPNIPILKDILKTNITRKIWVGGDWRYAGEDFRILAVWNLDHEVVVDVQLLHSPGILIPVLAIAAVTIIGGGILLNISLSKVDQILKTNPLFNIPMLAVFIGGLFMIYWFVFKYKKSGVV